ncbi:hypothetical protein PAXRUDRAFT_36316 [Paxillus rubicundulus Ve08.2h10]|uniref:Uncharacterized protein n=1 Tax=Paxillus rubicundulus Ve08.2h10 TaxID=930991 RepID=A0A0D0D8G9_9AGAM|nr:hypothetical protein PAXRUDRAFT_36316 [Paxillus rubicundulus Ve08.2h10]
MVEPWALTVDLQNAATNSDDPDKSYTGTVKKSSSKQDRTGCAMFHFAQSTTCMPLNFFLRDIYTGQFSEENLMSAKRKRIQYCAKEDRSPLFDTLISWRNKAHTQHPHHSVQPAMWLLDDNRLNLLSKTHPSNIHSAQDIIDLLQETVEWGTNYAQQLFNVITRFN